MVFYLLIPKVSVIKNRTVKYIHVSYLDLTTTYFGMFLTLYHKVIAPRHPPEHEIFF